MDDTRRPRIDQERLDGHRMAWIICKGPVTSGGAYYRKGEWISVSPEDAQGLIDAGKAEQTDPPAAKRATVITRNPLDPHHF
jgi:hypothetical protein